MTRQSGEAAAWSRAVHALMVFLAAVVAAWFASMAFVGFAYMVGDDSDFGEDVDWSTQPLEIVADGTEACVLNVDAVAPGRHDVAAFAEGPAGEVVIKDPGGEIVFRAPAKSGEVVGQRFVRLREVGSYRVECRVEGVVTSATLRISSADELTEQ